MAMTYATYVSALQNLAGIPSDNSDPNFRNIIPNIIDSAEQRCYRDLDLLSTVSADASLSTVANNRLFTLPATNHYVVVQDINIITPAGTQPDLGTRNPLVPVSKEFLNAVYNSSEGAALPQYFAMLSDQAVLFGPWPDQAYVVEVVGTIRPAPLSPTNASTFLTNWLPDLFIAASMIFVTGYQRDFGSQSDDPNAAKSWDNEYSKLLASAGAEEMRKKFASGSSQTIAKE